MKKVLILFLVSCFLFTGCGKKEIKYDIKSKKNYEFRVKVNGTIGKKSFTKNYIIYKFNDEQIKVQENNEELYYVFNGKLYKDKYGREELKEKYPTDFSYLYEIFDGKKKLIDKGEDLIAKKNYQFYSYKESKSNMNKLFKTLGIDVKVSKKPKVVLYLDNGYLYNVFYKIDEKKESYKIDIEYYDFKNVQEIKEKFYDDLVEVEKEETKHDHNDKYTDRFNIIDYDSSNKNEKRGYRSEKK